MQAHLNVESERIAVDFKLNQSKGRVMVHDFIAILTARWTNLF